MMAAPTPRREPATGSTTQPDGSVRLASTLVSYADRPDRRTVYPPNTNDIARMSTWITADADAFRELGAMR